MGRYIKAKKSLIWVGDGVLAQQPKVFKDLTINNLILINYIRRALT